MGLRRAIVAASVVTCLFMLVPSSDAQGFGSTCKYEDFFGRTQYYTCPRPGDSSKNKYCCGSDKYQQCCDKLFGVLDDDTVKNIADNAGAIIGIIVSIILFVIIAVFVCCCCCSCCLLAKMRERRSARNAHATSAVPLHQAASGYPTQQQPQQHHQQPQHHQQQQNHNASYPNHSGGYPNVQQSYSGGNGSYPPNQSYPSGYPSAYPAPYPGGQPPYPMPDQPPPYGDFEKQPPYNPNYQQ